MIIHRQLGRRHGHNDVVANDPGHSALEFEEFAYGAARAGRGQIADPVSELDQPDHDGAGDRAALHERGGDRERVEDIDVETSFPPPYAPGAQCDRIGVPQHQGHVDGTHDGIEAESHQQRYGRQREGRAAPDRRFWHWTRQRSQLPADLSIFPGIKQQPKIVEAHERQTAQRAAQHAFETGIVFNHQAGAGIVHARQFYAGLRLQPRDGSLCKFLLATQGRQMKPDTAGDKMPNRKFHCASPDPFRSPSALDPDRRRTRMAAVNSVRLPLMHFDEMIDRENGERDPNRRCRGGSDLKYGKSDNADRKNDF